MNSSINNSRQESSWKALEILPFSILSKWLVSLSFYFILKIMLSEPQLSLLWPPKGPRLRTTEKDFICEIHLDPEFHSFFSPQCHFWLSLSSLGGELLSLCWQIYSEVSLDVGQPTYRGSGPHGEPWRPYNLIQKLSPLCPGKGKGWKPIPWIFFYEP